MIAVRLMGGLGNQMFQYAAGRRLADKKKTKLVLDLSHFINPPPNETHRRFALGCFKIKAKLTKEPIESIVGKRQLIYKLVPVEPNIIYEQNFSFHPEIIDATDNTLLIGYWQSEKYFSDRSDEIKKNFTFKDKLAEQEQILGDIIRTNSVSIHVRRGDYVTDQRTNQFHEIVGTDYYQKAIKIIVKKIENPNFFVFSDDLSWCIKNIKINQPTFYVSGSTNDFDDMRLMSMCKHNIIANSSFSWWAAWLNTNPDKIVCAPTKWFQTVSSTLDDRLPKSWTRV